MFDQQDMRGPTARMQAMAARVVGAMERVYPRLRGWYAEGADPDDPWIEDIPERHVCCYLYMRRVMRGVASSRDSC